LNFIEIAQPGTTTFTDVLVNPNTTYCYRIRTADSIPTFSTYSTTVVVSSLPLRTIKLAFDDNAPNGVNPTPETGYQIERCAGAACNTFSILTSIGPNPPPALAYTDTTSPSPIAGYRVTAIPLGSGYSNIVYSTPPQPPNVLSVSPPTLTFITAVGTNPPTQTLTISNGGGSGMVWTASSNASWLSVAPSSGSDNAVLVVTVNVAGLVAGNYNAGSITVTAPGATGSPVVIPISLSVLPITVPGSGSSGRVR
jgi:hypothetical protein